MFVLLYLAKKLNLQAIHCKFTTGETSTVKPVDQLLPVYHTSQMKKELMFCNHNFDVNISKHVLC